MTLPLRNPDGRRSIDVRGSGALLELDKLQSIISTSHTTVGSDPDCDTVCEKQIGPFIGQIGLRKAGKTIDSGSSQVERLIPKSGQTKIR